MIDQTMPTGAWTFDEDVTAAFQDMLERSIPQYEVMRDAVTDLAAAFHQRDTVVLDLGVSRGDALAPVVNRLGAVARYVGVDVSEPMLDAARQRFEPWISSRRMTIEHLDLRRAYPSDFASVTLAILTLQFVPIEYRQRILRNAYEHTLPGGVLIVVEKVLGADAMLDEAMIEIYYRLKASNGYTSEAIERKRLSLEGVLVPVTADWNVDLLRRAGFVHVDSFWRWMNFAGWVAVRG